MTKTLSHSEAFIRAFIHPYKRRRYLDKTSDDPEWLIAQLYEVRDIDERYLTRLPGPLGIPGRTELYELMTSKGAPRRCSVTADYDPRWRELELSAAIDEVVGSGTYAAVVSSIPGALAYVENESGRFLLERARL